MSVTEILVVIGGLALGYWVVTRLIDDLNRDEKNPPPPQPWHEVLKVPPDAAIEDIRGSYQLLMEQYHPDKVAALGGESRVAAERKSGEINAAYREAMLARGGNSELR